MIDKTSQACGAIPILGFQGTDVTDTCSACIETSCCAQGAACGADATCAELRDCFAGCADSACTNACDAKSPNNKLSGDFSTCRRSTCGAECAEFSCIGGVTWGPPSVATVDVTLRSLDFQTGTPWVGISVKMCAKSDPECAAPLDQKTTDAKGQATFSIPTEPGGYGAFLEFTGDKVAPSLGMYGHTDQEFFFGQKNVDVPIFSQSTFNLFLSAGGVKADPERGTVSFGMEDCNGNRIAGLTPSASTADAQSTTLYVKGSLPTKNATATDVSGLVGVVNLPPGPVELTGTIAKTGQVFGKIKTQVRKGFITMMDINPSPLP